MARARASGVKGGSGGTRMAPCPPLPSLLRPAGGGPALPGRARRVLASGEVPGLGIEEVGGLALAAAVRAVAGRALLLVHALAEGQEIGRDRPAARWGQGDGDGTRGGHGQT